MREITKRHYEKSLVFEETGEEISVIVKLENISSQMSKEAVLLQIETLFQKIKTTLELELPHLN